METGRLYHWSIVTPQRWSALAPDFAEVEENVEYMEREDEFDIHPIEEIHKRRLDLEDEVVDVLTIDPGKSEFEIEAFTMPISLEVIDNESEEEIITVGPGTMRRKSPGGGRDVGGTISGDSGDEEATKRPVKNGVSKSSSRTRRR